MFICSLGVVGKHLILWNLFTLCQTPWCSVLYKLSCFYCLIPLFLPCFHRLHKGLKYYHNYLMNIQEGACLYQSVPVFLLGLVFSLLKILVSYKNNIKLTANFLLLSPHLHHPSLSFVAVILRCLQHGVDRGAGRLWEHLWPASGAVWELLRPVQKRHAAQPGRAVPLLCFVQLLRTAGPEKVKETLYRTENNINGFWISLGGWKTLTE